MENGRGLFGRLNARQVATAKLPPGKRKHMLADGGCLHLAIVQGKSGLSKSWLFQYQLNHKRRFMGLGGTHTVSLAEAREEARLLRQQLIKGIDPLEERRARTRAAIAAAAKAVTFQECCENYIRLHGDGWSLVHLGQWQSTLRRYVYPKIGRLAPSEIDSAIILNLVEPYWKPDGPAVTVARVVDRIAMVWDYAAAAKYCSGDNPARHVRRSLPKLSRVAKVEHFPAIPYERVPEFMARLRAADSIVARALEFLCLSAARTGEVKQAQWKEINWKDSRWQRPASHMKGNADHEIPLTEPMLALLRKLPNGAPDDLIFAGVGLRTIGRCMDQHRPEGVEGVVHGLRSSFRQWAAARTNFPDHVVEVSLAHKIGAAVERTYKRKAEMFERRRRLMEEWNRYCATASATTGEVVPMRVSIS